MHGRFLENFIKSWKISLVAYKNFKQLKQLNEKFKQFQLRMFSFPQNLQSFVPGNITQLKT